jgi:hypothetical protein
MDEQVIHPCPDQPASETIAAKPVRSGKARTSCQCGSRDRTDADANGEKEFAELTCISGN